MSVTLSQIINLADERLSGLLSRFDSAGRGNLRPIVRGDGDILDLRLVKLSATPAIRPFDDVDLAAAIAVGGVRVAIGKPDADPWFYCEDFTAVALTPVAISTSIEGSGTTNDVQLITLAPGAYGGAYSLSLTLKNFGTGDGTSNVARSFTVAATATQEQLAAILLTHPEAVKTGTNGIRVTGPIGGPFSVEFIAHQGNYNVAQMTADNVNLLLPKRITGVLAQQAALAAAFTAAGTDRTLTGTYEIEIQFPGDEPSTVLQVPVTISKDVITGTYTVAEFRPVGSFLSAVTGFTGGTTANLDGVPTAGIAWQVVSFVHPTAGLLFYQLVAGTDAEASPAIIRPDDYDAATNARVWKSVDGSALTPHQTFLADFLSSLTDATLALSRFVFTGGPLTGLVGYAPGATYTDSEFVRDFAMVVRGRPSAFKAAELLAHIDAYYSLRGPAGEIFDAITSAGTAQVAGGVAFSAGVSAPAAIDNQYEWIDLIYSHYLATGTALAYATHTDNGALAAVLAYPTVSNDLVTIAANSSHLQVKIGFGFQDCVVSTGYEAMCSILRFRALRQLAQMATAHGDTIASASYTASADAIPAALETYLWDAAGSLFRNASVTNPQHSIPASAFAVVQGCVSSAIKTAIAEKLIALRTDSDRSPYQNGQVRHLPLDENWDVVDRFGAVAAGTYQNGAFWATFTGWVAIAIAQVDSGQADRLIREVVDYCQVYPATSPIEASNETVGYLGSTRYLASSALLGELYRGRALSDFPGDRAVSQLIADITLSAETASCTVIIPAGFRHLRIFSLARTTYGSAVDLLAAANGDTGDHYYRAYNSNGTAGIITQGGLAIGQVNGTDAPDGFFACNEAVIRFHASSTAHKIAFATDAFHASGISVQSTAARWANTAPIRLLTFSASGGNLIAGSQITVFGLR